MASRRRLSTKELEEQRSSSSLFVPSYVALPEGVRNAAAVVIQAAARGMSSRKEVRAKRRRFSIYGKPSSPNSLARKNARTTLKERDLEQLKSRASALDGLDNVEAMRSAIERSVTGNRYVIDPREHEWCQYWDLMMARRHAGLAPPTEGQGVGSVRLTRVAAPMCRLSLGC